MSPPSGPAAPALDAQVDRPDSGAQRYLAGQWADGYSRTRDAARPVPEAHSGPVGSAAASILRARCILGHVPDRILGRTLGRTHAGTRVIEESAEPEECRWSSQSHQTLTRASLPWIERDSAWVGGFLAAAAARLAASIAQTSLVCCARGWRQSLACLNGFPAAHVHVFVLVFVSCGSICFLSARRNKSRKRRRLRYCCTHRHIHRHHSYRDQSHNHHCYTGAVVALGYPGDMFSVGEGDSPLSWPVSGACHARQQHRY